MREFDDPVTTDVKPPSRRRIRAKRIRLGAIAVVLVAGLATVGHVGSDQSARVATAGSDDTTASTGVAPDPTDTAHTTATTGVSTSTTGTSNMSTTRSRPATTATTTERPSTTTTTTAPAGGPVVTTEAEERGGDQISLPAGGVMFPAEAGRSIWEATSNGITIRVRVDPAVPRGGQVVRFYVNVSGPADTCCDAVVGFDGHFFNQVGRNGSTCPSVSGNAFETSFVYNNAGLVRFKVRADDCSDTVIGWLSGWLEVTEGQSSVQGPALPTLKLGNYGPTEHQGDSHYLPLLISAQDTDGWISQFVVDWGDGNAPETLTGDPLPCRAWAPWGWPGGTRVSLPFNTPGATSPMHFYSTAGTYTVTVTARSTACDGSQPQEGTDTMTWAVQ